MYFPGNQVVSEVSEAPEASEMVSDLTGSGRTPVRVAYFPSGPTSAGLTTHVTAVRIYPARQGSPQ